MTENSISAQASYEPIRAALPAMPKEECLLVGVYAHRSSTMAAYGAACFAAGQAATPRATADVELREAVGKLIKAKGRFHTEQSYAAVVKAYDAATKPGETT